MKHVLPRAFVRKIMGSKYYSWLVVNIVNINISYYILGVGVCTFYVKYKFRCKASLPRMLTPPRAKSTCLPSRSLICRRCTHCKEHIEHIEHCTHCKLHTLQRAHLMIYYGVKALELSVGICWRSFHVGFWDLCKIHVYWKVKISSF